MKYSKALQIAWLQCILDLHLINESTAYMYMPVEFRVHTNFTKAVARDIRKNQYWNTLMYDK